MVEENEEVQTFKGLGICDQLVAACDKLGWKNPSKIQVEAIPHALEGVCSINFLIIFVKITDQNCCLATLSVFLRLRVLFF